MWIHHPSRTQPSPYLPPILMGSKGKMRQICRSTALPVNNPAHICLPSYSEVKRKREKDSASGEGPLTSRGGSRFRTQCTDKIQYTFCVSRKYPALLVQHTYLRARPTSNTLRSLCLRISLTATFGKTNKLC